MEVNGAMTGMVNGSEWCHDGNGVMAGMLNVVEVNDVLKGMILWK